MRSYGQIFEIWMGVAAVLALARPAHAATISWKGHTWNVTNGGMAGVCRGNAANVAVDENDYLHMKISNNGGTWTAAEIFSTDKIGFGTYQWQIEGPTDKLDKNVVVGLFPYGPEAGLGQSGNNEIDIEFARWGNDAWPNGNYTVWPPTGSTTGSHTFDFVLSGGTAITTRFQWSSTQIEFATLSGFVPVGAASGLIDAWTFAPANPTTRITQEPMPLGMNLWCFDNPPSDGQNVELIVRDFQFVPLGAPIDGGAGGAGGSSGAGGGSGGASSASGTGGSGRVVKGGAAGTGGVATGGTAGARGSATGGAATAGRLGTGGAGRGGAVGSGGASLTGATRDGAVDPASAGGTTDSAGAPSSADAASTGGFAGRGGAGGATVPTATDSGGCSCILAYPRAELGGPIILLAVPLLLARRQQKRRRR